MCHISAKLAPTPVRVQTARIVCTRRCPMTWLATDEADAILEIAFHALCLLGAITDVVSRAATIEAYHFCFFIILPLQSTLFGSFHFVFRHLLCRR